MLFRLLLLTIFLLHFSQMAIATPHVGDRAPEFQFVDIDGKKGHTHSSKDGISILFFVGLDSVERLEEDLAGLDIQIIQAHPNAQISYLNFADLRSVPSLFQDMAGQVMQIMNNRIKADIEENYRTNNVQEAAANTTIQLIPDWSGAHLDAFGLQNADQFSCWIISNGRIIGYLPEGTDNLTEKYLSIIDEALTN